MEFLPEPRLKGELIGYSWSVFRPSSVVCPSLKISNIFFSKSACPIKAKLFVERPWIGGTNVCSWHLGHMTKMAAMPIYGKKPFKHLLQNWQADFQETSFVAEQNRTYTLFLSGHINMTFEALTYKTVSRGIITYIKHNK